MSVASKSQLVDSTPTRQPVSAWAPLGIGGFALLWSAMLVSTTGTWIHDVGAGWLMTTLNPSPEVVTLVQAATTLPIFLFALPAGTLADRVDKRKLLVVVNLLMAAVIAALAWLVARDLMTPTLLITITFLIGTGAAFSAPTWQAVVPELVPRGHLQPAVALNSMGINISRAIGPAIAGFLITGIGLAAPFVANAASQLLIVGALLLWRRPTPAPRKLPPEPMGAAMLTGLRHALHNGPLKATLIRAVGFFLFASAYWGLLPLIARGLPDGGAEIYGFLLGSVGTGAVGCALLMPKLRATLDTNRIAALGAGLTGAAMIAMSQWAIVTTTIAAALLAGAGWIMMLTSLYVSAQTALADWVRARGLAIFMMVFFGSMAVGSATWGQVAKELTVYDALLLAGIGVLIAIPLTFRARLGQGEDLDLTPSSHWPTPVVHRRIGDIADRGPVMITIEYEIDAVGEGEFLSAIYKLSGQRYRDGAYQWNVFQDAETPGRWIETFLMSSWVEHLRQHERATQYDKQIQDAVNAFHVGPAQPRVRHWLAPA